MSRDVWFFIHQTHTIVCVLCTLAAFIVISVEKGVLEYSPSYIANINPHPAIGFTVLLLSFLQPTMALFRPGAKDDRYGKCMVQGGNSIELPKQCPQNGPKNIFINKLLKCLCY